MDWRITRRKGLCTLMSKRSKNETGETPANIAQISSYFRLRHNFTKAGVKQAMLVRGIVKGKKMLVNNSVRGDKITHHHDQVQT